MSSWYSNILTTTTSRISNLRSTLLGGDADGDTEDDTHVCRVLRAYYTEKGRGFPGWLPPDPKAPPPVAVAPVYAQSQVGSRYGALAPQSGGAGSGGGGGASLSSLWDNNNNASSNSIPGSLRQGRGTASSLPPTAGAAAAGAARPGLLPSQRLGSTQSASAASLYGRGDTPPGSSGTAGTTGSSAQDRLRNRLFGGGGGGARTASPATQAPFPPPASQSSNAGVYGRNASYNSGGGGGGGTDGYEDRFAPGGMYDAPGRSSGGGGGSGRPFVAANAPWASDESEYAGSGGGGGSGGGRPAGLPGGPRRTGGLPSGPRMR